MLNPTQEENACLYLLDDLSPSEKSRFEAELKSNLELSQLTHELSQTLQTAATSLTPIPPPKHVWDTLQTKLQNRLQKQRLSKTDSNLHPPALATWNWQSLGWPLAACLALAWTLTAFAPPKNAQNPLATHAQTRDFHPHPASSTPPALAQANSPETSASNPLTPGNPANLALITNTEIRRLTAELEQTRATNQILSERVRTLDKQAVWFTYQLEEYLSAPPSGANRLLISRLSDPSTPEDAQPDMLPGELVAKSHQILVSQILSALQTGSTPANTSGNLAPSIPQSPEVTSPSPSLAATTPTHTVTASNPFQSNRPDMDTLPGMDSPSLALAPSTAAFQENASVQAAPPESPLTTAFGIAVYDQQESLGTLIVDSLPDLNPDRSFQMWAIPVGSQEPVNIGLLPSMPYGGGQVQFSLPDFPGLPSRFLITEEPQLGSPSPTGAVILNTPGF